MSSAPLWLGMYLRILTVSGYGDEPENGVRHKRGWVFLEIKVNKKPSEGSQQVVGLFGLFPATSSLGHGTANVSGRDTGFHATHHSGKAMAHLTSRGVSDHLTPCSTQLLRKMREHNSPVILDGGF